MKQVIKLSVLTVLLTALVCGCAHADKNKSSHESTFARITGKKLIETGWDEQTPEYIRDHIGDMEKEPFEGLAIRLPRSVSWVFQAPGSDKEKSDLQDIIQDQTKILSSIKWGKFTDNFIVLTSTVVGDWDWYDDSMWEKVLSKVRLISKAANVGGCVGVIFDPEPYGYSLWNYSEQTHADKYAYPQYAEKLQQRGRQFMEALQSHMPAVKVLQYTQYSDLYYSAHYYDLKTKQSALAKDRGYGLLLPFTNGMLEAANPNSQLIDGVESSFYFLTQDSFYKSYWRVHGGGRINVPDSLKEKYNRQVSTAPSIYVDQLYGMRPKTTKWQTPILAFNMTPEERDKQMESNLYYAFMTSDEYVWLYSEGMNWWTGTAEPSPGIPPDTKHNPPPGIREAILSAKEKVINGTGLGYEMEPILESVKKKVEAKKSKEDN